MRPFFGKKVDPDQETRTIEKILEKYRNEKPCKELQREIYDDLSHAKAEGLITIPFRVVLRKTVIEVLLDTKV